MVVFTHTWVVLGMPEENTETIWFNNYWVLAVFFGLSGFLITGSALRLSLKNFIINRSLRIVPALGVDVVFCALVLGPLITSVTLRAYFSDAEFRSHFLNIFGYVHYQLPGLFEDHPSDRVNTSLWTVPYEIGCYVIMSGFIVTGALQKRWVPLCCVVAIVILGFVAAALPDMQAQHHRTSEIVMGRGSRLFVCFVLGILAYLYRHSIPYDGRLFAACVALCIAIAAFVDPASPVGQFWFLNAVAGPPLVYIMAWLGVTRLPKLPFFHRGDYSYGIYLYGFPIQQLVYQFCPDVRSVAGHFALSAPPIVLFAACSWHLVEYPILKMRKRFSFVARQRIAQSAPDPSLAGAAHYRPLMAGSEARARKDALAGGIGRATD